jgi:hypothetical protein
MAHPNRTRNIPVSPPIPAWNLQHDGPSMLPASYFWTWDHSCNWCLDDPGLQTRGCYNRYYKKPDTFLEDYRRLTDVAQALDIRGIVIWGFLRDAHGGEAYARQVADYAAAKGVAILPGVGTTWYGGVYYEGASPYALASFLEQHPDARMLDDQGNPRRDHAGNYGACLAHPAYQEWLQKSLAWLFREFPIGGVNLENGDFLVDHHPLVRALRAQWPADDPEVFFHQGMSYRQALDRMAARLDDGLCTFATYSGFQYSERLEQNTGMGKKAPAMFAFLPPRSIAQWTLTGMLKRPSVPLTAFLDDGAPPAVYDNPNWPRGVRPPSARSVGFLHQGSQWDQVGRYRCIVGTIKEACLRAVESGLEGISIHGEVTSRHIPWALNYLAFSHFTHWPQDTLRAFGRKTLGQVLGSDQAGEDFAVVLAHWDAGTLTDDLRKLASPSSHGFSATSCSCACPDAESYQRMRFWEWLESAVHHPESRYGDQSLPI